MEWGGYCFEEEDRVGGMGDKETNERNEGMMRGDEEMDEGGGGCFRERNGIGRPQIRGGERLGMVII